MSLIELKNVTLGYDNHIVLRNISFKIEENDFICVVGPNGSGKSTLIKGILGLIKPIKGKITYKDLNAILWVICLKKRRLIITFQHLFLK